MKAIYQKTQRLIMFILLITISGSALARITPPLGLVQMDLSNGNFFSANQVFGGTIRYYVSPSLSNFRITMNGSVLSLRFNIGEIFKEAIAEWKEKGVTLNFIKVDNPDSANLILNEVPRSPAGHDGGHASARVENGHGTIEFYTDGFSNVDMNSSVNITIMSYLEQQTPINFFNMLLYFVCKHELGHILGFEHNHGTEQRATRHTVLEVLPTPETLGLFQVPIMLENYGDYIDFVRMELAAAGGRLLIRLTDIMPAWQEGQAYQLVNNPLCYNNPTKNIKATFVCPIPKFSVTGIISLLLLN